MWPDFFASPPFHSCVHDGVCERRRRGTKYVLDSEWEMLQQEADLYRLATHVHRGQSASSRKCVYKWGSYFYCFCHFTRSPSYRASVLLSFFSGTSSYFLLHYCFPLLFMLDTETAEVSFEKVSPYLGRFPGLRAAIGEFSALVFPLFHGQALCPPSHMTFGQLPFYLNRAFL